LRACLSTSLPPLHQVGDESLKCVEKEEEEEGKVFGRSIYLEEKLLPVKRITTGK
jgi:hypothetical protein